MSVDVRVSGSIPADVVFNQDGLVPVVVQDDESLEVLMLAWMDAEAIRRTLEEGRVTYFSRSRREYWRKGDTSGNVQWAQSLAVDCDGDTLLLRVDQTGPACHTGASSCFEARS
ncbi:phosphoribosyl-AMP cyclohydrolase [Pontimonas sp.]|uniref:phosphoribosyl-AMP cyclohydrolase n=1 Tax=Pontimonas sp. TaxID=2304492 RepID=UPI0028701812|nr:phosphoribosyl-AMP cyclohydrolase [Pontimonas sp.]MDR9396479.1 phosphoribosyl-AMP cyclohydrolase [Pontimonas sp.]MDR9433987.1 phosphoribosyl-AMP cyclohydrolase [Pontimonas sp.]